MSAVVHWTPAGPEIAELNFSPWLKKLSDSEFYDFCQLNKEWRIEQTSTGDLIIVPGTGGHTGWRNAQLTFELTGWAKQCGLGRVFDSSTIFTLPNGAKRSPHVSWISTDRWNDLSELEHERFPPLCPDFVIELRSRTDLLTDLESKMEEYRLNGTQLGWLIDRIDRRICVYRPDGEIEVLDRPQTVSGESVLPGFVLTLAAVWE